ncbi:MAG: hypothetical protein R2821_11640 [Flavobacteriaceae bacterium]
MAFMDAKGIHIAQLDYMLLPPILFEKIRAFGWVHPMDMDANTVDRPVVGNIYAGNTHPLLWSEFAYP